MSAQPSVGKPISRLEGKLKVTGAAKYAAEYTAENLLYGYAINSTITKGKIIKIDATAAKALDGVVEIFTHENRMDTASLDLKHTDMDAPPGTVFKPLKMQKSCTMVSRLHWLLQKILKRQDMQQRW